MNPHKTPQTLPYTGEKILEIVIDPSPVSPFKSIAVEGVGIHTGRIFEIEVFEAPLGQGIQLHAFFEGIPFYTPARWSRLSGTTRATALVMRGESRRRLEIRTIEHFMAAAFMSDLKDLDVYIRAQTGDQDILEMPILDGSAKNWWSLLEPLRSRARERQSEPRKVWRAIRRLEISDGNKKVILSPLKADAKSSHFLCRTAFGDHWKQNIEFQIDWKKLTLSQGRFGEEIAPARTFGFKHEIDALLARGLALGGTLDNALVLDGDRLLNVDGFRIPQEIAAHKLLDAIGDFSLLECPLIAEIELIQAGHSMHLRAVEEAVRQGILVQDFI